LIAIAEDGPAMTLRFAAGRNRKPGLLRPKRSRRQ
jgi:hypothetical protein